jgi:ERCC4-related helicase
MLVNALQTVDNQRRLYISDFTLFVLDECHHCGQKHPYEILMKMVREYVKKIDKQKLDNEKPQVVGLTASIGTRRGETPAAVTKHIFQLCVNMLATQISTIRNADNLFELYKYVNPPDDDIKPASRPKNDLFRDQIYKLVEQVIEYIYPDLVTAKANIDRLVSIEVVTLTNMFIFRRTLTLT